MIWSPELNRSDNAQRLIDIARAYRSLFLDDDGNVRKEADAVLRDLENVCGWMPKALPTIKDGSIDPMRIVADAERRMVFAHIKTQLFKDIEKLKRATEIEY